MHEVDYSHLAFNCRGDYIHYPGDKKTKAVVRLATSPALPPATIAQLVAELRAPEDS